MDRYAIFVDAGYFFAAGSQITFGTPLPRKQIYLKSPQVTLAALCAKAYEVADGLPLLRTYWYDAMPGAYPSLEQSALATLSGVKLRFGALNSAGQQKGVDSLIVTDLIDLARNRAIADAVVVAGDEDLCIAVQVAQALGVRVHILAVGDPSKNVSPSLQREADSLTTLDAAWFSDHLERALPAPVRVTLPVTEVVGAAPEDISVVASPVIKEILDGLSVQQVSGLNTHFLTDTIIPSEYDRQLVTRVSIVLGRRLFSDEMRRIRGLFVRAVKSLMSEN